MRAKSLPLTDRHLRLVEIVPDKQCTGCDEEKPATSEFFGICRQNRTGLTTRCRECLRAAARGLESRQQRSRRKRVVRARTIDVRRISKIDLAVQRALYPDLDHHNPRTRGECSGGPRPCPYVSCKHNLYLDVDPSTGSIKLNFPDLEAWEMGESCALDVAGRGPSSLEDVGVTMNVTRERVRQLEEVAIRRLVPNSSPLREFNEY